MKPSIGRIVHYSAFGTPKGEFPAGACRAAIVTEVGGHEGEHTAMDGVVGLCVLNPSGMYFSGSVVQSKKSGSDCSGGTPGTWHWPAKVE